MDIESRFSGGTFWEPSVANSCWSSKARVAKLISMICGHTHLVSDLRPKQQPQPQPQQQQQRISRRRERRLRSWWRHERMEVAAALAEATHHSFPKGGWSATHNAPWGPKTANAQVEPTSFQLFDEEDVVGDAASDTRRA